MKVQKNIKEREDSLKEAYRKLLEVGLGNGSTDDLSSFIERDVMGYGTARDEKILSINDFIELIQLQRKQSINFDDFHYTSKPVLIRFTDDSYTAVVVDEIELVSVIGNDSNKLDLRMTSVFNFMDGAWKLIHWHGSTAEHVSDGEDPWHVNEWKKKTEKLEQMVEEKTVELIEKNNELEIEASLERVRAVAMGMNKSDDLLSICEISYKEFRKLGFDNIRNALIHIQYDEQKYFMDYDFSDLTGGAITKIEYGSHPVVEDYVKQIRSAKDAFYQGVIKEEQLEEWKNFRRNSGQIDDPRLDKATALYYYFFSIGIGDIGISALEPIKESQIKILKRFRNVFDLAYRRYNDIALAEEQARETQIQLALERVRARTMAMQSSNELKEVVLNLFDGLKNLGVDPTVCNISLIDKKTCDSDVWSAHQTDNSLITYRVFISHFEHPFRKKLIDSFLNKISFSVHELSGDLKKSYIQYLIDHVDYSKVPDEVTKSNKKIVNIEEGIVLSAAYMKYGLLIVSRSHAISDDESDILQRFAKIFEQTYTRFLDLQRAEAQAREAQIELALERVRARTMAMQQSDELSETARVLFQQFKELGEDPDQLSIGIVNESEKVIEIWLSLQGNIMNRMFKAPIDEPTVINKIYTAWKEKRKSVIIDISGDELERYHRYVNSDVDYKDYNDVKNRTGREENRRIIYTALFSKSLLSVATHEPRTEETIKILERFAGVFDGTYTRFLDLQKAEAQAREAQIEAALERVRSRSMAMHKSDELGDLSFELVKQVQTLGIDTWFCAFNIYDDDPEGSLEWGSNAEGTYKEYRTPREGIFLRYWEAGQRGKSLLINEIDEKECPGHYEYLCSLPGVGEQLLQMKDAGISFPTSQIDHVAYFKYGYIIFITFEPAPEAHDIFKRFAKVFEQTYTRFLDLKKAEAQAREAQIEAALEKVRSRSMGMQKSEELKNVIRVVYEQFVHLKINVDHAGFVVDYTPKGDWHFWIADEQDIPLKITHPYFESVWANQFNEAKEKGIDFFATNLNFEEKNKFYNELLSYVPGLPEASKDFYLSCPGLAISTILLENVGLYIENFSGIPYSDEDNKILMRFGKVFQQTYTRFLDLQKAEAQAREAQIELSMERIRAQVTAMRESSELLDIVVTMRSEFVALGHEAHYFWHMRYLPDKYEKAMTSGDGTRIGMVMTLPRHIHGDIKLIADWEKSNESTIVLAMDIDTAVDYVEKMITLGDFQQVDPQAPTLDDIRHIGGLTFIMARTTHGEIGYSLPGTIPDPPNESLETLTRFAGVFDLAYRRFEDLKEAEEKNKIIRADNERKTKELEDARQLQLSMLPKALPKLPHLDIAVYMKTATEVGGDYYDFNVDANGTLTFIVGDATGHGMMSGMMVSIMKSFFISNRNNIELKQFFENANNSIKDMQLGRLMMALIGVQITSEKIIATNAGMPSLLYFRNKSKKAGEFVSNNLPLGGMKGTKYLLKAVRYEKGDTLLLMSDGFAELKNSQNEQYGYVRIKEIFRSLVQKSSSGIIEELKTEASQWTNGAEPDDDITFVVIKFL
jgi:serine phosphatase RsbU (regulator of sigma subunit)